MRSCPNCTSENDETRVFCTNCGTRLPLLDAEDVPGSGGSSSPGSAGVSKVGGSAPPLPGGRRKVLKKPAISSVEPKRGLLGVLVSGLVSTAIVAAVLACLIQMAREPDHIPAVVGIDTAATNETFTTLRELTSSPKASSWTINSKAVNQFLETTIQMKPSGAAPSLVSAEFQRAFVLFDNGSFQLGIDQKFFGQHLYFLLTIQPESKVDGLGVNLVGGSIGRMPVHPYLLPVFQRLFEPVVTGLSQPIELLRKVKSVTITPEDATLKWPGTGNITP